MVLAVPRHQVTAVRVAGDPFLLQGARPVPTTVALRHRRVETTDGALAATGTVAHLPCRPGRLVRPALLLTGTRPLAGETLAVAVTGLAPRPALPVDPLATVVLALPAQEGRVVGVAPSQVTRGVPIPLAVADAVVRDTQVTGRVVP